MLSFVSIRKSIAVFGAGLLATAGVAQADLTGQVNIDGSSTVYPITEKVAEEFSKANPGVRVTVGVSGTGGGFKRFAAGETDISNASRPIKGSEAETAKGNNVNFVEIPVAYDGLTIVVNKDNNWASTITVDQLKAIFVDGSTVKTWKDIDPSYPATPIKIYSPGTDSGTFDYFKEVVLGKSNMRADVSVSEDDNVLVTGVVGDKGAIGFFGCAYYFENQDKLISLKVVNDQGTAVKATPATIESGEYNPFSRPLFIYVSQASLARPEVRAFVDFYLSEAPEISEEVGYVRLPQTVYDRAKANVANAKTGSAYLDADGKAKHGSVVEIYK